CLTLPAQLTRFPPRAFCSLTRHPPTFTLFPYTTLFRSICPYRANSDKINEKHLCIFAFVKIGLMIVCYPKPSHYKEKLCTWTMLDRKSTRLNSSHVKISYAVFCLKKKIITLMANHECDV